MTPERPPLPLVIAELARDVPPVTPLPSLWTRYMMWTAKAVVAGAIVTLLCGLRPDLGTRLQETAFLVPVLTTLGLALCAAAGAFVLSVPGVERWHAARWPALAAAIGWGAWLWTRLLAAGDPVDQLTATPPHPACVLLILGVSALPGLSLFTMLRHAAPLQTRWTGVLAALASLALGAVGTQCICPIDAPAHHVLWHFAPVVVLSVGGLALGAHLFNWRRGNVPSPPVGRFSV